MCDLLIGSPSRTPDHQVDGLQTKRITRIYDRMSDKDAQVSNSRDYRSLRTLSITVKSRDYAPEARGDGLILNSHLGPERRGHHLPLFQMFASLRMQLRLKVGTYPFKVQLCTESCARSFGSSLECFVLYNVKDRLATYHQLVAFKSQPLALMDTIALKEVAGKRQDGGRAVKLQYVRGFPLLVSARRESSMSLLRIGLSGG